MLAGRLFHAAGPATEKALHPSFDRVLGTSKCPSVADRRSSSRITPKYIDELLVRLFWGTKSMSHYQQTVRFWWWKPDHDPDPEIFDGNFFFIAAWYWQL